ncbi:very short patch repair endonuclease [Mucilaginibacter sp. HD30]
MADVHSKNIRSFNMSRIRSKDTKPEILVRKFLFSKGFRFRLHEGKLPGKPDIVLPKYNSVIFIHGCFWHGHKGCRYFVIPKTRTDWWLAKITGNQARDKQSVEILKQKGWNIINVWECELKKNSAESTLDYLENQLRNNIASIAP